MTASVAGEKKLFDGAKSDMQTYAGLWILTLFFVVAVLGSLTALLIMKSKGACTPLWNIAKMPQMARDIHGSSCNLVELLMWSFAIVCATALVLAVGATVFAPRRALVQVES